MGINGSSKAPEGEKLDMMERQAARLKFQSVNWASERFEDTRQGKLSIRKSSQAAKILEMDF